MIITIPNPILTTPAGHVKVIDKKVRQVVEKLKRALINTNNPRGVGLAAPQIGIPLQIFITRPTEKSAIEVFVNPEIIWQSDKLAEISRPDSQKASVKKDKKLEGCLSIANIWGHLKRPEKVKLRYMDLSGKIQEKEFYGFMATIIQHETDHLNGILFTQRVLEQKEKLYRIEKNEKGEEKMVEIEI
ncbi:peptide deformylase [Candidatus Gottesmanbacteria bacterium]|nr:peptide deformylase [Candidatus Gottesmanbacteria bacterium]